MVGRCAFLPILVLTLFGCRADSPQGKLESMCVEDCESKVLSCGAQACLRGCRLMLDRLVEHEGHRVIACVARAKRCDEWAFSKCAVDVGPHADGGPPVARPVSEDAAEE